MKKFIALLLAFALLAALAAGCAPNEEAAASSDPSTEPMTGPSEEVTEPSEESTEPDAESPNAGSLEALIEAIYTEFPVDLPLVTVPVDLADEWSLKSYTGLDSPELVQEAVASESMIGSQPYSLALVRVKDAADAETVAQQMHDGIDQRKWVCVEADDMLVSAYGDLVMLIMVGSNYADTVTAQDLTDAFQTVCGDDLSLIIVD